MPVFIRSHNFGTISNRISESMYWTHLKLNRKKSKHKKSNPKVLLISLKLIHLLSNLKIIYKALLSPLCLTKSSFLWKIKTVKVSSERKTKKWDFQASPFCLRGNPPFCLEFFEFMNYISPGYLPRLASQEKNGTFNNIFTQKK